MFLGLFSASPSFFFMTRSYHEFCATSIQHQLLMNSQVHRNASVLSAMFCV
jgi:hypothetical protein